MAKRAATDAKHHGDVFATLEVDIALAEHGCSTALDLEARVAAVRDRLAADLETPSASS